MATTSEIISNIFGQVIRGENIGTATESVLTREGERMCVEGMVTRLYESRWTILLATVGISAGLVYAGATIQKKLKA